MGINPTSTNGRVFKVWNPSRLSVCTVMDVAVLTVPGVAAGCSRLQQVLDKCSAQYEATGAPTVILGKHHHGYAIPLTVCGQEVGGGETAYTFHPSVVREEFLLFMSDSLTITAASHETMTMMGVR